MIQYLHLLKSKSGQGQASTNRSFSEGWGRTGSKTSPRWLCTLATLLALFCSTMQVQAQFPTAPVNDAADCGQALDFDGSDDYVSIPDNDAFEFPDTYTLEAWFKTGTLKDQMIVARHNGGTDGEWYLGTTAAGRLQHTHITSDDRVDMDYTYAYNDDAWHHLAGVYTGAKLQLYLDGVLVNEEDRTGTTINTSHPLTIGSYTTGWYWNGTIDEVKVWNRPLTAQEVLQSAAGTHPADAATALTAHYDFDNLLNATTLADITGNGHDGTLTNMDEVTAWVDADGTGYLWYADADGDGYAERVASCNDLSATHTTDIGTLSDLASTTLFDCDDNDPAANPAATEILFDGIDNDCNPFTYDYAVVVTYTAGDIPTQLMNATVTNSCPGEMSIDVPPGKRVTTVDVEYTMTGLGSNYLIKEQRSLLVCATNGEEENSITSGVGNQHGTYAYNRTGLIIAQGLTGSIDFELRAWRNFGTSDPNCGTIYQRVDNNSWSITVHLEDDDRWYPDQDGDGYVTNDPLESATDPSTPEITYYAGANLPNDVFDCDDNDPAINPGLSETLGDGIDNDCNPATKDVPDAPANNAVDCGQTLAFDGSDDYVSMPDDDAIDFASSGTYTLEAWIKPESFNALGGIISKYQSPGNNSYYIRLTNTTAASGITFDGMSTADGILTAATWYHVAAVNNGGTRELYINGSRVALTGTAGTFSGNSDYLAIGRDFGTASRSFNGAIDEVKIWNRALTAQEVSQSAAGTHPGDEATALTAHYDFNDQSGSPELIDVTGNGHDGDLTNINESTAWVNADGNLPGELYYADIDGDNYVGEGVLSCTSPGAGYYLESELVGAGKQLGDCNDSDMNVNPGATEEPGNGIDDDCNPITSDGSANSLHFDGTDDYVSRPDDDAIDFASTGTYTLEAWIKPESFNALGGIISKYQSSGNNSYYIRLTNTTDATGITFDGMSTADDILTANTWYHVAAVNNGGTRTLYLNGQEVALSGTAGTFSGNSDDLAIGRDFGTASRSFNGAIDEVRIWNVVRTEEEITASMNCELIGDETGLVAYYPFNQGDDGVDNSAVTTLTDATENGHDGTLTNFALSGTSSNWVGGSQIISGTSCYSVPFITTWQTTTADESITIPTAGGGYSYTVDWGDGSADATVYTGNATHQYATAGTYTVSIEGTFPRIHFNNTGDRSKILTVERWGDIAWTSMANAFTGCTNLTVPTTDAPDLSGVTDMSYMFAFAESFNEPIGHWDVSNVTDMTGMLSNSGLSTANYDATLIGWADDNSGTETIPSGIELGADGLTYCDGTARALLTGTYGWTINGDAGYCPFITTWQTTTANESITIPTTGTGYSYMVDWGDGSTDNTVYTGNATHEYATADTYTVSITGDFPRIYFNNTGDKDKILTVEQWGDIAWTSMANAFFGCTNLTVPATDAPDLSNVTDMGYMFAEATSFNQPIGHWDVGNVTNMEGMFGSGGGSMAFNQGISSWDVSNVTNMSYMFSNNNAFDQDLGGWNVSNVTIFYEMFYNATAFNQDLGNWDISNVELFMTDMLTNSGLSTANYDATLIGWADDNGGTETIPTNLELGAEGLTYSSCAAGGAARNTLINVHGWTINGDAGYCPFITTWQTNDGEIDIPTEGTGYDYDIIWTNLDNPGTGEGSAAGLTGDHTITGLQNGDTYQVEISGDFPRIYFNNAGDKDKILTVEQWGGIAWESMAYAFHGCSNLTVPATDAPDLSNVTDMSVMFALASSFNDPIDHWDVSNVTAMNDMFYNATAFNRPLNSWNVSNVTNMYGMFARASSFDQDIGNWDISSVTNLGEMLYNSGLSITNYDATLIGWADDNSGTETIPAGLTLYANGLTYSCAGAAAHDQLTRATSEGGYGWAIIDAGEAADETGPVPDVTDLETISLQCGQVDELTNPTATDNCSGEITGAHDATLPITESITITWTFTDGSGNESTQTQEVVIEDTTVPELATIGDQEVDEGTELSFTVTATDVACSVLTYSLDETSSGKGMAIDASSGTFTWTPANEQIGMYEVIITVSDGELEDSETITITVNKVDEVLGFAPEQGEGTILYPNPARESFEVRSEKDERIRIFDLSGRLQLESRTNASTDISQLREGIYLIEFSDGTTLRLIKR